MYTQKTTDVDASAKLDMLKEGLHRLKGIVLAFSGGVDSTFLLKVSREVLGKNVVAVTARSSIHSGREIQEAIALAEAFGVRQIVIESEELAISGFSENPVNRCYICKRELFSRINMVADQMGFRHIAEGSNTDDLRDYRPGLTAVREMGILSPLQEASLGKDEIRSLSLKMGLPTWDKPSCACLASRVPYGQEITREKLQAVEAGEQFLTDLGFRQVRVRHHGDIARIEVGTKERARFFDTDLLDKVDYAFKAWGFAYITLDLKGYRTGSMNEILDTATGRHRGIRVENDHGKR